MKSGTAIPCPIPVIIPWQRIVDQRALLKEAAKRPSQQINADVIRTRWRQTRLRVTHFKAESIAHTARDERSSTETLESARLRVALTKPCVAPAKLITEVLASGKVFLT